MKHRQLYLVFAVLLAANCSFVAFGQGPSGYHLVDTIKVGGEGGWDILIADAKDKRLFVSHGTHVVVIDTATDKVVGDIPKTNGVHGVAFGPKYGFTTNGRDNTVTMFDIRSLAVTATIPTDKNPDALVYDKATDRVFVFNGRGDNATVIDASTGKVVGTVALGGKPEFGVSDGKGKIFVNLEDKSEIVEIDAKAMKVLAHWPLGPGEEPSGLAIDTKRIASLPRATSKWSSSMQTPGKSSPPFRQAKERTEWSLIRLSNTSLPPPAAMESSWSSTKMRLTNTQWSKMSPHNLAPAR
jgi:YVTN family beta-propeller protein